MCGMTLYRVCSRRSTICAQAVYFLHSTMSSVTCLRLSDVSVICCVTYFQFLIQSAFLSYIGRRAAPALRRTTGFITQYRTSDVVWGSGSSRVTHARSMEIAPIDREHRSLSCTVFEIYIARYWSKISDLNLPHLGLVHPLGPVGITPRSLSSEN